MRDPDRSATRRTDGGGPQDAARTDRDARAGAGSEKVSASEWIVASLSALFVLAALGSMPFEALTVPDVPPILELGVDSVFATQFGYVVEFHAINHGEETAADVIVEGTLHGDAGIVQRGQVTIDFVPTHARREGGLLFTHDPARFRLELRAVGSERP